MQQEGLKQQQKAQSYQPKASKITRMEPPARGYSAASPRGRVRMFDVIIMCFVISQSLIDFWYSTARRCQLWDAYANIWGTSRFGCLPCQGRRFLFRPLQGLVLVRPRCLSCFCFVFAWLKTTRRCSLQAGRRRFMVWEFQGEHGNQNNIEKDMFKSYSLRLSWCTNASNIFHVDGRATRKLSSRFTSQWAAQLALAGINCHPGLPWHLCEKAGAFKKGKGGIQKAFRCIWRHSQALQDILVPDHRLMWQVPTPAGPEPYTCRRLGTQGTGDPCSWAHGRKSTRDRPLNLGEAKELLKAHCSCIIWSWILKHWVWQFNFPHWGCRPFGRLPAQRSSSGPWATSTSKAWTWLGCLVASWTKTQCGEAQYQPSGPQVWGLFKGNLAQA